MPAKFSSKAIIILTVGALLSACENNVFRSEDPATTSLSNVPAVRLNYRYEADVPAPAADPSQAGEERNAAVQADFDATRQFELLDRTVSSPDKKKVAAIYRRISDLPEDYRIDLYTADGKLLKKLTSDSMAMRFPETLRWSPDSSNLAFLAAFRKPSMASLEPSPSPTPTPDIADDTNSAPTDANAEATPTTEATPLAPPTPLSPTGILTFRTEQIYMANADGSIIRPVTQTEGLKYYYLTWAPDSSMLAAMAATEFEWNGMRVQAESKGEHLIPKGRPRIVEKNGRERRLDDNITDVWPVWSPDSSKVATAFGTQVRIYDAAGISPTQAAIPLRNQMLLSAKAYEESMPDAANTNANTDANAPAATPSPAEVSTLPDESKLVSFNPIVELVWSADDLLYLKTAYVRHMLNEADSVMSFMRWHRLVLSAQAATPAK
jgi:hypothetical protein